MNPQVPTTQAVTENIIAKVEAEIEQTVPLFAKAALRVIAKALGGEQVILHRYASWILLQMFAAHASFKETTILGRRIRPLVEIGRMIGVGDPYEASRAELNVSVTVQNQTGTLAAGTELVRPDTQIIYQVVSPVELNAATVTARVRASSDPEGKGGAGVIGNLEVGDTLEFANPLPNVARVATVTSVVVQGAEAESENAYRARVLRRRQQPPQGGAYADYRAWAEEVPGIVAAYPYAGNPGEVDVYVEATADSSGSEDGIPTSAQLDAVLESIQFTSDGLAARRPVNAAVNVLPITRIGFTVTVAGLAPDTADLRAQIEAGIDEYLRSREPYIEGLSTLPRKDRITQSAIAGLVSEIVDAAGGLVNSVSFSGGAFYTLGAGEKAKITSVIYT